MCRREDGKAIYTCSIFFLAILNACASLLQETSSPLQTAATNGRVGLRIEWPVSSLAVLPSSGRNGLVWGKNINVSGITDYTMSAQQTCFGLGWILFQREILLTPAHPRPRFAGSHMPGVPCYYSYPSDRVHH